MDFDRISDIRAILAALSGRPLASAGFVAVVSPAVRIVFPGLWRNLNGLLRAAGAAALRPVASGIPEFAARCAESIRLGGPGVHVLSACPAAIDFLAAEFPEFLPSVLSIPSPMAISSEAALRAAGILDGTAIAVSSCSLKKNEASRVAFDMHVIVAGSLFKALAAAGIRIEDFAEDGFDVLPAYDSSCGCDISCMVGEALAAHGVGNSLVMKLEGANAARQALANITTRGRADRDRTTAIELTFCENGCVSEPSFR